MFRFLIRSTSWALLVSSRLNQVADMHRPKHKLKLGHSMIRLYCDSGFKLLTSKICCLSYRKTAYYSYSNCYIIAYYYSLLVFVKQQDVDTVIIIYKSFCLSYLYPILDLLWLISDKTVAAPHSQFKSIEGLYSIQRTQFPAILIKCNGKPERDA